MLAKISFKYFYSDDIERYSFYRIPKQLFTLEPFKGLMPCGEPRDRSTMIQAYQTLIRKNIDYDNLMTFPDVDHELAQEIYELIVETVLCLGKEIVISSNRYPTEVVRSRFLKINYMHIRYVMECLPRLDQLQRQLNNSIFLNPVCQQH